MTSATPNPATNFSRTLETIANGVIEEMRAQANFAALLDTRWECSICGATRKTVGGKAVHEARHVQRGEFTPFPPDSIERFIAVLTSGGLPATEGA
jgi:hypothetical protein